MAKLKLSKFLLLQIAITSLTTTTIIAQEETSLDKYIITTDSFENPSLKELLSSKVASSQFVMIGEQHGIKEVGDFTKFTYQLAQPSGYKHLCIETDAVAAEQIKKNARSKKPIETAKENYKAFPLSIPFYNNIDDYHLFNYVIQNQGEIWGIDQTFMAQFRLNLDYLENTTQNERLREKVTQLKELARLSFEKTMSSRDFKSLFIFQYSDELHSELIKIAGEDFEKEILNQFKTTREIYLLNFKGQNYASNAKRSHLMKRNFLNNYNTELKTNTLPKIIFKLGDNHVMRGLNNTNIYDIANLVSEFAIVNNMKSTHIKVAGINGNNRIGNPFTPSPTKAFDNTEGFPIEIQQSIQKLDKKYFILDLSQLRNNAGTYSKELQEWMFKFDFLVLIKDCNATQSF